MLYATATEVTLRVTTSCRMDVYLDDKLKCLKIIMYVLDLKINRTKKLGIVGAKIKEELD